MLWDNLIDPDKSYEFPVEMEVCYRKIPVNTEPGRLYL